MGYNKLSINGYSMARVKWVIRRQSQEKMQAILQKALSMSEATEIRDFLNMELEYLGLGGLVRAGK